MSTLYLVEQGAELGCDGERLVVRRGEETLQTVPLARIEDAVVFGNVALTTPVVKRLLDANVTVTFLTVHGRYHGRLVGRASAHVELRRAQYRRAEDNTWALGMAQQCVEGKLRNCRVLLQRFCRNRNDPPETASAAAATLDSFIERVARTTQLSSLLGVEGSATACYFGGLRALFDSAWGFDNRNRRPPRDPVNVLLSLGYTLLSHKVLGAVEAAGFDPYQGFLHQTDYNRPSLSLDLMEEFRPLLVDSLVLRCCADGRITHDDFAAGEEDSVPIILSDAGKRRFIAAFEERMRTEASHPNGADGRPGKVSYLRCLDLQARQLARCVRSGDMYQPFTAR